MDNRLICIIGIDGSGKSTVAKLLTAQLNKKNIRTKHIWGGYECYLLLPFVLLGERIFLSNADPFENYKTYHMKIQNTAKISGISKAYQKLTLLEYFIQMFIKIQIPLWLGKVIVADRYIYDILINLAVNLGYTDREFRDSLKLVNLFSNPNLAFFIDTPIEIAFKRKNDIPSLEYLKLRRDFYLIAASYFNMVVLDGTKNPKDLEQTIEKRILDS